MQSSLTRGELEWHLGRREWLVRPLEVYMEICKYKGNQVMELEDYH